LKFTLKLSKIELKRYKHNLTIEIFINGLIFYLDREFKYSSGSDNHSLNSEDSSSSDVLSFSEEDVGIEKTEKWLNQNDILNNVNWSSEKHRNSTTNPPDDSFSSIRHSSFEDMMEEKKEFKFVLERENNNSEVLTNIFGEAIGSMFSHASLLTLTIVMWLILWLWGTGNMEEYNGMRNPFVNSPDKRTPITADYYEIYDYSKSYFKIILATVFMIGVWIMKWGGLLSKLQFDPHKITRKAKKA